MDGIFNKFVTLNYQNLHVAASCTLLSATHDREAIFCIVGPKIGLQTIVMPYFEVFRELRELTFIIFQDESGDAFAEIYENRKGELYKARLAFSVPAPDQFLITRPKDVLKSCKEILEILAHGKRSF